MGTDVARELKIPSLEVAGSGRSSPPSGGTQSPLPWAWFHLPDLESDADGVVRPVAGPGTFVIRSMWNDEHGRRTTQYVGEIYQSASNPSLAEANCKTLVRAVNCHEGLVRSVRELISALEQRSVDREEYQTVVRARAALSKATET